MTKNVKSIFLVATLLFLLVGVSAISASEVSDDNTIIQASADTLTPEVTPTITDNKIVDTTTKNIKTEEQSTDLYVSDTTGSDDNSGTNTSPYKTIQKALDTTTADSTYNIHIAEGTYKGLGNTNLTVNGNYNINLIGTDNAIIDGEVNYTEHVTQDDDFFWGSSKIWEPYDNGTGNWAMNITTGNGLITITNLTIQNCWNPGGSSISLYNTSTIDNYGNLEVNNVSFIFNHGGTGGAIRNNANSTIIIKDSLFEGNRKASTTGNYGAGIYNNGTATIINSTFQNNYARWGTVTNDNIMTIINSTLRDNIAYDGGSTFKTGSGLTCDTGESDFYASWNIDGIVTIVENCTFINNDQCDVYQGQGILSINNSIFINSTGVYISAGLENNSHIINNSVFEDMRPSSLFGDLSSSNALTFAIYKNTLANLTITNCNISSNSNSTINTRDNTTLINNNINGSIIANSNNTIENNTIISNYTSLILNNDNIIHNNNITTKSNGINIRGSKNNITNNNITSTQESIITTSKNARANNITNNTLESKSNYAIYLNSSNNNIIDNYMTSSLFNGDETVNNNGTNTIENNTPESTTTVITDDTYNRFFDDNGHVIKDNLHGTTIYFAGEIHNKTFIFDQELELDLLGYEKPVLMDCIIEVQKPSKITLTNITMNTTNPDLTYQLLLNSTDNTITYSNFYANTTGRMRSIIINDDNNNLNRLFMNINATSNNIEYENYYGIADTIGILITSNENTIENTNLSVGYTISNGTLGTITGVSIQSPTNTKSNKISNITVNVNGDQYAYGLNILNSHNNTLNNTNNRYNTFNVNSNNYANAIQLSGNVSDNTIKLTYINMNSSICYGIIVDGYIEANNNLLSQIQVLSINSNTTEAFSLNNANNLTVNQTYVSTNNAQLINSNNLIGYNLNNINNSIIERMYFTGNNSRESTTAVLIKNSENNKIDYTNIILSNGTGIEIYNSENITVTNSKRGITYIIGDENGIYIQDSKNINISSISINSTLDTIIVNNTSDSIIENNTLIKNNETGGDATIEIINSNNITLNDNRPDIIVLTDSNYHDYFVDDICILSTDAVINFGSDLYNKNLIFNKNVTVYGNNYTLYNGTMEINTYRGEIYYLNFNSTDDRETLLKSNTTYMNAINNCTFYQENDNLIRSIIKGRLSDCNITIIGVEKETNDNSPSILAFYQSNFSGINLNITSKSTDDKGYAVGIEEGSPAILNMTMNGFNVTASKNNGLFDSNIIINGKTCATGYHRDINPATSGDRIENNNITVISDYQARGLVFENIDTENNNINYMYLAQKNNITVLTNNTGVALLLRNFTSLSRNINFQIQNNTFNGDNADGIVLENIGLKNSITLRANNINLNNTLNKNITPVKSINTHGTYFDQNIINPTSPTPYIVVENGDGETYRLNMTAAQDGYYITIKDSNNQTITASNMTNEYSGYLIQIINSTATKVTNNYLASQNLKGSNAVEVIDSDVTLTNNRPGTIITEENYDEYFQDGVYIGINNILEFGSDLYNKTFIFDKSVTIDTSNNYTLYNPTFKFNNATQSTINYIKIDYTRDNTAVIEGLAGISYSEININGNNITLLKDAESRSGTYTRYNNITITGENINIFNTTNGSIRFTQNNLTVNTNNSILFEHNYSSGSQITYNNIIVTGDNNIILNAYEIITYQMNNLNMETKTPLTIISTYAGRQTITYNNITISTRYNDIPVIFTNTTGTIRFNYIETLDVTGDEAISSTGAATVNSNTPTYGTYESNIIIEAPTLIINGTENLIKIKVTDKLGNPIKEGNITLTTQEQTITTSIVNGKADTLITPTITGTQTITATLNSEKYSTKTSTLQIKVQAPILTIDPITATIGETINITARITADDETLTDINKGKVTFKVNGKTLKDANGKVIYAKVVNGVATIENYEVPTDWSKEGTTIEAVYSGSTQCDKLTSEKTEINIEKATPTLTTSEVTAAAGETITLTATITDNDKVINTGKVVFKINGKTVKNANGKVIYAKVVNNQVSVEYTLPVDMKAKDYNITATFISSDYERIEDTKTLTVTA